jgi:hypothetical protein
MAETTHGGFQINAVSLRTDGMSMEVEAKRRRQRDGSSLWAVTYGSEVLNRNGEWEYEPIPSSRDDDFLRRCRFASLSDAILAFEESRRVK